VLRRVASPGTKGLSDGTEKGEQSDPRAIQSPCEAGTLRIWAFSSGNLVGCSHYPRAFDSGEGVFQDIRPSMGGRTRLFHAITRSRYSSTYCFFSPLNIH
jgi:hypothetical protein